MKKSIIGKLFGIVFTTPIEVDSVLTLVDSLPELLIEKVEENGLSESEAVHEVKNELFNFIAKLEESDSSDFLNILDRELLTKDFEPINDSVSLIDPDKTKWNFYIRFRVSEPLGVEHNSLRFLEQFIIEPDKNLSLREGNILVLRNDKSLLYREILPLSKKVEQALIMAFSELGIGIAYPENLASSFVLDKIQKEMERTFISHHTEILDNYYERPLIHFSDKFGVELFQEESLPFDSKATQEKEPSDVVLFDESFSKNYNFLKDSNICDDQFRKIELASSILTTSIYDDSLTSKIILSMTVIEILSEKVYRADEELRALDFLVKAMSEENDFNPNVKSSLTRSLNSIRVQSIGKSCKSLVKSLLGKKDAQLFYKLYDYRSQLVHAGTLKDDYEKMYKIYKDSFSLAQRLLSAYIKELNDTA